MVSNPMLLATPATTGAAPVPVPPPMPAVTNTICVPSVKSCLISSRWLWAALRPSSGLPPAPRLPMGNFTGMGDLESDLLSVLHTAKLTSTMPSSYMLRTALQPPPPTPTTLISPWVLSSTGPKSMAGLCTGCSAEGLCVVSAAGCSLSAAKEIGALPS